MNDNLAINDKAFKRTYVKLKAQQAWHKYKKQRILVTKLIRRSIKKYFNDKCNNTNKNRSDF